MFQITNVNETEYSKGKFFAKIHFLINNKKKDFFIYLLFSHPVHHAMRCLSA